MKKIKLIFFGNEQLAQGIKARPIIFDTLRNSDQFEICAILLTNPNHRKPYPIEKAAKNANIPVYFSKNNDEIMSIIEQYHADVGVLASYGKIVPERIINAFPNGIINIHPSKLPKYRGTTPIESALLNGDEETAVSVMRLAKAMDAGNILAQKTVKIADDTTKQDLYESLAQLGGDALVEVLPGVVAGNAPETAQDEAQASFTAQLDKSQSQLQPSLKTAETLSNEIRAFAGFPKSKLELLGVPCAITWAHVADSPTSELDQKCQDGKYLVIDRLIPENSKEMDAKSFLNGHKK